MVKTVTRLVSAVSITASATLPRPTKVSALEVVPAGQIEMMNRPSASSGGSRNSSADRQPEQRQHEQMRREPRADQLRLARHRAEIAQAPASGPC